MASRTGINISGHYVVSINNAMPFQLLCTLNPKKLTGRTESYFIWYCF